MDNTVNFSETPQPKREYTRRDGVMAWLTVALFACFFDAVLNSNLGLCSSLFMLALYGMSAVYLKKSGVALKNMLFLPVVGCMLSASFFFTDNTTAKLLVFCFDVLIYSLWLLYASGNAADPDFDTLWYDSLKALFVMPFSSLYAIFFAMCRNKNGKSRAKLALWVFLGVLLAAGIMTALTFGVIHVVN